MSSGDRGQATHILLACGDIDYGATIASFLDEPGTAVERCHDAPGVLRLASRRAFDVVVLDLELGGQSDIDLVSFVRQHLPAARLILLFEMSRIERALEGVRHGAYFYLPNTCPPSDVALAVGKARRHRQQDLTLEEYERTVFEELVGRSPAMQRVVDIIRKVAPTDSTVLLMGESGTGKEVLANTVHRLSRRRERAFIAVNCAALPEALLESELFGHVKGAFTGAHQDKRGLFEEADGGTIFLDEIGDMALVTQAKLLRVLQNGETRPVGANLVKRVDVRVLAATNRDLLEAVRNNEFREDLYFRLNVIQLRIPPLRERMDALPTLINHFLSRHNAHFDKQVQSIDDSAMSLLRHYDFPGNVRELESVLAHAVIMADDHVIRPDDLPDQVRLGRGMRLALPYNGAPGEPEEIPSLADVEERHIRDTLERLDWNQTLAAEKLGISRSTLWRKLQSYDIEPRDDTE